MRKRGSGILLHVSSLPSNFGIGDLGLPAMSFADFLQQANQSFWQILPLNSISPFQHFSPYNSTSSLACSLLYLSPDHLLSLGLLSREELQFPDDLPPSTATFSQAYQFKASIAEKAFRRTVALNQDPVFLSFCNKNRFWLEDHALYTAISDSLDGESWAQWPQELRDRHPEALEAARSRFADEILKEKFIQYLLENQINVLRFYCRERGIQIIGDLPIYVSYDSSDVWAHRPLFKLDNQFNPAFLSGVPPDRFSPTGQLWANPVYDWEMMTKDNYRWWIRRFERMFQLYDMVRIDHFRGFVSFWQVPVPCHDCTGGEWISVPTEDFFHTVLKHFPCFPVIAEDLGSIDSDVREVIRELKFPGTKVLLFAFDQDDPQNPYLPHNLPRNCMACTGTHDTNTVRGWIEKEADVKTRENLRKYLGRSVSDEQLHWELVRLVMMSVPDMAVFPLQDILGLGQETRMNRPGTERGNWLWRAPGDYADKHLAEKLAEMTRVYGRGNQ